MYGHVECVKALLDGGADVTAEDVRWEREMKNRECEQVD